jgi:hypothetical protein
VGVGDSGYNLHGSHYNSVGTVGGWLRVRAVPSHLELGIGGLGRYEPSVSGDQYAPYNTPGVTYEEYVRQDVVQKFLEANPSQGVLFPNPTAASASSWVAVAYLGFGGFGPLTWNNVFARVERLHPLGPYVDSYNGLSENIYVTGLTSRRYQMHVGDEAQLTLIPHRLDAVWGFLFGYNWNEANTISSGQDNFVYGSSVLRLQLYLTQTVHYLLESSLAREVSQQGNLFRTHSDSIFQSTRGVSDSLGLEFGDSNTRDTWQLKTGVVLNPTGYGIFTRPSLRLLYGLQYSTQQAAFGNGFGTSLNQYNVFQGPERHWHSLVAIEAEEWF